jgi:hypothetical protein
LQAHSPRHAHGLWEVADSLRQRAERSPIAQSIAAALPGSGPVAALDIAAMGLPLGAVLAEVGELAELDAVRVHPPLAVGDSAAGEALSDLGSASWQSCMDASGSMKVAVAGPAARACVESLGPTRQMEGITDRLPRRSPQPWVFTRLAAGPHLLYVVADSAMPGDEAWYPLLRGAVGLVVTVDAGAESWHVARSALEAARVTGLPCVLAGEVDPEQVRAVVDALVPVATQAPGDARGSRAALRLLATTITSPGGGRQ